MAEQKNVAERKSTEDRYLDIIETLLLGNDPEPATPMDWARYKTNTAFRFAGVLVGVAFILIPMFTDKASDFGQILLGSGMGVVTTSLAATGTSEQNGKGKKGGTK